MHCEQHKSNKSKRIKILYYPENISSAVHLHNSYQARKRSNPQMKTNWCDHNHLFRLLHLMNELPNLGRTRFTEQFGNIFVPQMEFIHKLSLLILSMYQNKMRTTRLSFPLITSHEWASEFIKELDLQDKLITILSCNLIPSHLFAD